MDLTDPRLGELHAEVARLDALEQIRACIHRCARALDRLDRGLLVAQFWPDAQVEYGAFYRGPAAGFVEVALRFQGSMRETQHCVSNILIDLNGDAAAAESYVQAHHTLMSDAPPMHLTVGGRYLDRFVRREGVWRLSFRTEVIDWGRQLAVTDRWFESNDPLPKGRRDRKDLSYEFLAIGSRGCDDQIVDGPQ